MTPEAADQAKALGYVKRGAEGKVPGGELGGVVGGPPRRATTAKANEEVQQQVQAPPPKAVRAVSSLNVALEQDPRAVLQTGPGVPSWPWRTYALTWSGPVKSDQTLRLFLVSPGWNRLITVVRLLLVLLLAVRLSIGGAALVPTSRGGAAALAVLTLLLFGPAAQAAESDVPDRSLLDELKLRLTRFEPCHPQCVATPALRLRLANGNLAFEAEVHAGEAGAWAIPGPP